MVGLALSIALSTIEPQIEIYNPRDLTFNVPNFNNAPRLNMNTGIPGSPSRRLESNHRENEEKLDRILDDLYGDEYKFIRWNGHLIVKKR